MEGKLNFVSDPPIRFTRPGGFGLIAMLAVSASCVSGAASVELPARFEENRIFLVPKIKGGETITFFTDTGGGWNAIQESASIALGFPDATVGGTIPFPEFTREATIPANGIYKDGRVLVVADEKLPTANYGNGFLGGRWFGDKVWEFDYLNEKIRLLRFAKALPSTSGHIADLGFQVDGQHVRTMHFPRIQVEVDGRQIDLLFDTGATARLTENGAENFGAEPGTRIGTSFIRQGIFDEWRQNHPDWKVVANADLVKGAMFSMIEVPEITIGGYAVGPVWFAKRPDRAFLVSMSSMMDAPVHGAIRGSALQYFRIILDYSESKAYFFVD